MNKLNIGIVGTGFIAGILAPAIQSSKNAQLSAVSSRTLAKAEIFAADYPGVVAVEGADWLIARDDVDAVYVATPTAAKEEVARRALAAGKHVLIEKPLHSKQSFERLSALAREKGLVLMDATHFVHHPRTAVMRERCAELIGAPRSLHTMFYFPFSDRDNIRFDPDYEPMGAVGDMAWYSMRAVVEYLAPEVLEDIKVFAEHDRQSSAVIRATGVLKFDSGKTATFDVGYTAGAAVMDLALAGTSGILTQDDFVLDWHSGFGFDNPDIQTGFVHRSGMATRKDFVFIETPSEKSQHGLMIDNFANLIRNGDDAARETWLSATAKTQGFLDAIWREIQSQG
ncbi:Gfo/Idh/MocA family protein [Phyllobacterium sophorae]|uniref:Gfo/Idh/MocA family oxidoreductase n=1 Tax=Phyllobacterium sophorae TaxID=1520277 RepID=A0A2P7BFK6_9HYPH|nr:Gfo/Idh/MocA family oxidoreductase [Phyllobacterium sophorae]PSH65253.1 gfo/Idh/MocA family oxidoreductase [Phyllobacterium sophorae]